MSISKLNFNIIFKQTDSTNSTLRPRLLCVCFPVQSCGTVGRGFEA